MNQIRGAREARMNLTRGERGPEYREACIRDYVQAHRGEVMQMIDFSKAAYGSDSTGAASALIKKLIKRGRLTRVKVKNGQKGVSYTYLWHEQRIQSDKPKDGPVTTRKLTDEEREALSSTKNDTSDYKTLVDQVEEIAEKLGHEDALIVKRMCRKYISIKAMNTAFMMTAGKAVTININQGKVEQEG